MTVSPLAPAAFPAMPDIKGVTLSTAASGMKYTGRDDMLLMRLDGSGTPPSLPNRTRRQRLSSGAACNSARAAGHAPSW